MENAVLTMLNVNLLIADSRALKAIKRRSAVRAHNALTAYLAKSGCFFVNIFLGVMPAPSILSQLNHCNYVCQADEPESNVASPKPKTCVRAPTFGH
jgi:hypothetical protein